MMCKSRSKSEAWCYKSEHIAGVQKKSYLNYPFVTHYGSNFYTVQINQDVGDEKLKFD